MVDQLRADHVGWSPRTRIDTPHLDRIAEGAAFLHCVSANPVCTPARCALLTGRYSRQVNMLKMAGDLSRDIPTYPQALQRAGYATAGIGKFHWLQTWKWGTERGRGVDLVGLEDPLKGFGFDHVWEASGKQLAVQNYCHYCAHLEEKGLMDAFRDHIEASGKNHNEAEACEFTGEPWPLPDEDYPDLVITDRMLEWIDDRDGDRPFFLFGSWLSPHQPHDPPASYLEQTPYEETDDFVVGDDEEPLSDEAKKRTWKLRRAYKAMVRMLDDQVGRIFAKLEEKGLLDNTVIVFVSDHGEMLGDHGRMQKSIHWHQSAVVPCAIRHPRHLDARRIEAPVELTDLTATLLDCAGLDPTEALSRDWPAFNNIIPGRSLLPALGGETDSVREFAFSECSGEWSMLHSPRHSYVRFHRTAAERPHELLFDLTADPDERHDLAGDPAHAGILEEFRGRLFRVIETHPPCQTRWAPLPD